MTALSTVLQWLFRLRSLPLWLRLLSALLLGVVAFLCRSQLLEHQPGAGRDLLLVAIVLSAFCWGFWPGLVTGFTVRGLSLWWFVGPPELTLVRPWHDIGVPLFIIIAVLAGAAAGRALLILAGADQKTDDDHPPRRLGG